MRLPARLAGIRPFAPLVVGVLILLAWWGVYEAALWPPHLFPSPRGTAEALWDLAREPTTCALVSVGGVQLGSLHSMLGCDVWITLRRLLVGFALSLALGALLAIFMVRWPTVRRGLQPYLLGIQSLPGVAWVPLAILWLGFTEEAMLFVTVLGSFASVAMAFSDAVGSVPPVYYRAARNMGVGRTALIARVGVPAALPHLVAAIRQGWSFAWRSLVGAEIFFTFASAGLGFRLDVARSFGDPATIFGVMALIIALGILFERVLFARVEDAVRRRWGLAAGHTALGG